MAKAIWLLLFAIVLCGSAHSSRIPGVSDDKLVEYILYGNWSAPSRWMPKPRLTWNWILQGPIPLGFNVSVYDIDMFNAPNHTITDLHNEGKHVICYVDVGTYEPGRPDSNKFPPSVLGNPVLGWPGEYWLDITQLNVLGPIMWDRFVLAAAKNCNAIEPDNIDGYQNPTGFDLTYQDQITYNTFIAKAIQYHAMSAGLKNDVDQVKDLLDTFDWALDEQCHQYNECDHLQPFIYQNKAVFEVEYIQDGARPSQFCPSSNAMNFSSLLKGLNLYALPLVECLTEYKD